MSHGPRRAPRYARSTAAVAAVSAVAAVAALAALPGCFGCNCDCDPSSDPCQDPDPALCATACCDDRGVCTYDAPPCLWLDGEPCDSDAECLSGACVNGTCTAPCVTPCGDVCCEKGADCVGGACVLPPPPPPPGGECDDLATGAPAAPGDVGDCCDTRWPMVGGPCLGGLACLNGWCTTTGCTSDADCAGALVEPEDRSPFPDGTAFGCLAAGSGAISYCAPTGSAVRLCGGATGVPCDAGEACTFAIDPVAPATTLAGVCEVAFELGAPTGTACFVPSARPCMGDEECRTPFEECGPLGTCQLVYPASRYQCAAGAGAFELVPCGAAPSCDGPGGPFQGGCFAGFFSEAGACTEACSVADQNCPGGLECADLFGTGVGVCVGVECGRSEGPIDASHPVWGAGLATADLPCAVAADCDNGGLPGARCLDGFCEFVNRVLSCPAGAHCSTVLGSDGFPQDVPEMDPLQRSENDTITMHCAPAVPSAPLAPGDPCIDSADCSTGLCDVDVFDAEAPLGRCTHPCANDADCPAGLHCIDLEIPLGPGARTRLPVCLDVTLFGLETCTAEAPCPMTLGCAPWSARASVGVCFLQTGVVEGFIDNLTVGSSCDAGLSRCLPGDNGMPDSTADDAAAGACLGDDRLVIDSNNCRSLRCWDADDLDGGPGAAATVNGACSAVCRTSADCDAWSRCRELRLHDNSTDDPSDDSHLGLCVTFRPASTVPCAAGLCTPGAECDDGDLPNELGTGGCYTPSAAVGAPCTAREDCPYGGRCQPAPAWPGGACTVDGCAFDAATGVGPGTDCPGGSILEACWAEHGAAGRCLPRCDPGVPCRPGYACTPLPGSPADTVCLP